MSMDENFGKRHRLNEEQKAEIRAAIRRGDSPRLLAEQLGMTELELRRKSDEPQWMPEPPMDRSEG
jgi:hypothetical protein